MQKNWPWIKLGAISILDLGTIVQMCLEGPKDHRWGKGHYRQDLENSNIWINFSDSFS